LRFLNSMYPSGVVAMYSNPFSVRSVASLTLVAVLQWYSSFSKVSISCV